MSGIYISEEPQPIYYDNKPTALTLTKQEIDRIIGQRATTGYVITDDRLALTNKDSKS